MSKQQEELNAQSIAKHLHAEVSSAPKSGSPSSESMQAGAGRTPIKKREVDEFKSPSQIAGKEFTPKILKHHAVNQRTLASHKSPAARAGSFWALSSSAKKDAQERGFWQQDAPWPSPAQTVLRRHVNSLRTNLDMPRGEQRPDLFASPLTATPNNPVSQNGGQNQPPMVRPWSTSPIPQPGSRAVTRAMGAKHADESPLGQKVSSAEKHSTHLKRSKDVDRLSKDLNQSQAQNQPFLCVKKADQIAMGKTTAPGTESSQAKGNQSYKKCTIESIYGGTQQNSTSKGYASTAPMMTGMSSAQTNEPSATASFGNQLPSQEILQFGGPQFLDSQADENGIQMYGPGPSNNQYGNLGVNPSRQHYMLPPDQMKPLPMPFSHYRMPAHGYHENLGYPMGHPGFMHPPQMHMPSCAHHPMQYYRRHMSQPPLEHQQSTGSLSPSSQQQQASQPVPPYYCQSQMMPPHPMCGPCQMCFHHHPQCAMHQRHHVFCSSDGVPQPPSMPFKRPQLKKASPPENFPPTFKESRQNEQIYHSPEPKRLEFAVSGCSVASSSRGDTDKVKVSVVQNSPKSVRQVEEDNVVLKMPHQLQENMKKPSVASTPKPTAANSTKTPTGPAKPSMAPPSSSVSRSSKSLKMSADVTESAKVTFNSADKGSDSSGQNEQKDSQMIVQQTKRRMFIINPDTGEMERIIRKRKRKNNVQLQVLVNTFEQNENWTKEVLLEVSKRTNLSEAQVYKWGWDQKRKKYGVEAANLMMQIEKEQNAAAARKAKQLEQGEYEEIENLEIDGQEESYSDSGSQDFEQQKQMSVTKKFEFFGNITPQQSNNQNLNKGQLQNSAAVSPLDMNSKRNEDLMTTGASYKQGSLMRTPPIHRHDAHNQTPNTHEKKPFLGSKFQGAINQTVIEKQPSEASIPLSSGVGLKIVKNINLKGSERNPEEKEESSIKVSQPCTQVGNNLNKRQTKAASKQQKTTQSSSAYSLRVRKSTTAEPKQVQINSKIETNQSNDQNKENKLENKVVRVHLLKQESEQTVSRNRSLRNHKALISQVDSKLI